MWEGLLMLEEADEKGDELERQTLNLNAGVFFHLFAER